MEISNIKNKVNDKLSKRDYFGMFEIIDKESNAYLDQQLNNYNLCIELMNQNQDLYEFMGASKQFEMASDLQNKLRLNRNKLFISCLSENQNEMKAIFKRAVGDFSKEI